MSSTQPSAPMASVRSRDGTTIGYRRLGDGPGVVLLHGGGQASQNLMTLAGALSDCFTIYLPDRRGRGMSGPYSEDHGIGKEVEDLDALLGETGAHNVFGLSVGAVIAIEAARSLPGITKLALYEPPLSFDGITQTSWLPRYERELEAGQLASALVTIMKGTADRTAFRFVPRFLLVRALSRAIQKTDGKPMPAACEVLLLGGAKSARNLAAALDGLSTVFPGARRVTLPGVGHTAADNGGKPELVAAELRAFFS